MITTLHDNHGQANARKPGLVRRVRRWYLERRTAAALNALTDFELNDVGVQRCRAGGTARELLWMAGG